MRRILVLLFVCLALVAGCSDPDSSQNNNQNLEPDAGDVSADGTSDVDDDTGPASCELQADCAEGTMCHGGVCVEAPECGGLRDWDTCVEAFEALEPGLGRRAVCGGEHCRIACLVDQHCADGQVCADNGSCVDFTGEITGEHPGGDSREPLEAGVANTLMTFPIGLSQGGYGSRSASGDGRYVESLRETDGQMHGLYARAFVLDNGERQLMFIRLPVIFPTMPLHEAVARKLQEETGKDWRDSLIISGTHTHSGPTRYWQLPDDTALPLGSFGTDEFSQQVFDWTVDSTFEAAKAALDDLSPARFGWEIVEAYDTDDYISSDRWSATPPFDDNRLLLFRIDDAEGNPRAVMISYGTHGTVHGDNYFTGDAPAGAERALEARLGEEYDRFVPVLYFNQNGGSMSPRGDRWGHGENARFEAVGHELADRAIDALRDMTTETDISLAGATHRFPITYENVGYAEGEWKVGTIGKGSPGDVYDFGGLQCVGEDGDDDYSTSITPPVSGCLPLHLINHHRSITLFAKSQMTALDIGGLTVVTLPGEATMEFGWQVLKEARDQFGIDPLDAWIWGYAQDHQFYLTPSNLRGELPPFPGISTPKAIDEYPDYAFSWRQGGYEAGMSVWGWKFGDFLVARAMETVSKLTDGGVEPALPAALPTEFSRIDESPFPVETSNAANMGTFVDEPPATVSRLESIDVAWVGGDPGAEMPQAPLVVLEKKNGDTFEAVETVSKRTYSNREPVMLTRRRKNGDDWEWAVRWEELQNFPTGEYRFRVEGHYLDDNEARQSYEATSGVFEVVATDTVEVEVTSTGTAVEGRLGYPAASRLRYEGTSEDPGRVTGNFRMRHPRAGAGISAPLVVGEDVSADDVTVRVMDGATEVASLTGADLTLATNPETVDGRDGIPVTRFSADVSSLSPGSYTVEVTVTDAYGNTGTGTAVLDVP
ncbi:hypothetical protein FIV42_12190 [Persicimonas caeni]|uniref:Neutral ceramidase n=1 Tax=Persicimonas caeni TaxID=2292766 RepID=A0A4Y6PTY1_PERCE|nr:neutral/alkaline non-lysosomal ceramidase N-terminal domain-containing protein [Persicimonas caeni]QDG51477.1 hypothetical protein FIV42_12190 [Persicimonas caeni]QED32698.1 hypothetical protein FRD00_12185 [Persicimonas caeni]